VKQNPYAIGYVELIYALQQKLPPGEVKNKDGQYVAPTIESTTAAAAGLASSIPADLRASIVNAPGAMAYPIAGLTWLLAYKEIAEKAKATALTRLLYWAIYDGQQANAELGYAPLPPEIVKRGDEMIQSIQSGGAKAFPGR
jgi:phosphate transport system substrate-binding protein